MGTPKEIYTSHVEGRYHPLMKSAEKVLKEQLICKQYMHGLEEYKALLLPQLPGVAKRHLIHY